MIKYIKFMMPLLLPIMACMVLTECVGYDNPADNNTAVVTTTTQPHTINPDSVFYIENMWGYDTKIITHYGFHTEAGVRGFGASWEMDSGKGLSNTPGILSGYGHIYEETQGEWRVRIVTHPTFFRSIKVRLIEMAEMAGSNQVIFEQGSKE